MQRSDQPDRTGSAAADVIAGADSVEACVHAFAGELDFLYRSLRRMGLTDADVEDVAQDVFLVMLGRWPIERAGLRPWLLGASTRVAFQHQRRIGRETPRGLMDVRDERLEPDHHLTAHGARQLVGRALAELKGKQREVFVLHELEGVPIATIAAASGLPLQTLYSRLKSAHRAFGRIVRRLGRFPGNAVVLPALLGHERARPALPAATRARILARARATEPGTPLPIPIGPAPVLPASGLGKIYLAAGAVAIAAACASVVTARWLAEIRATPPPVTVAELVVPPPAAPLARVAPPSRPARRRAMIRPARFERGAGEHLASNLIGYWRFDDAGAGARDLSGNGTDCVLRGRTDEARGAHGPEPTHGAAVGLAGEGWLECADPRLPRERDSALSIAVWVKPARSKRRAYSTLVTRQLGDSRRDHFFLGLAQRRVLFNSDVFFGRIVGPVLPEGRWSHVAATVSADTTILYVDGVEVGRAAATTAPGLELQSPLLIGAGINGPPGTRATERFHGALDELAIYDRALGRHEIAALARGVQPRLSF